MGRRRPPKVSGVALVDKPAGCTSHDVVQMVRRGIGQSQVGHTGTLDPAATGLMVTTLGRATRIGRFLEATDKEYLGLIRLGRSTTTWDGEGETVESKPVKSVPKKAVEDVLERLRGEIEQVVPVFSAVKVDGERLHAKARRGEAVEGPRRRVIVYELELISVVGPDLRIRAVVSKGTYIRSLAVVVGRALSYPAHLARLRRTRVGPHKVEDAYSPDRFGEADPPVIDAAQALLHLPARAITAKERQDVAFGRPLRVPSSSPEGAFRIIEPSGGLAAVAHASSSRPGWLEYDVVLIRPEDGPGTV